MVTALKKFLHMEPKHPSADLAFLIFSKKSVFEVELDLETQKKTSARVCVRQQIVTGGEETRSGDQAAVSSDGRQICFVVLPFCSHPD